jgi:uncharacterized protein (TIGR00255 family)
VRESVRRGTVQVNLRVDREATPDDFQINASVLDGYRCQLDAFQDRAGTCEQVPLATLLLLPGTVIERSRSGTETHTVWPTVESIVREAVDAVVRMRAQEGQALAADLLAQCRTIGKHLNEIAARAPLVTDDYRRRLTERVNKALAEFQVSVQPADLVRDVSLFVDRSDISEEIVRLESHLKQFETALNLPESAGRKLEFIAQEMGREINTIGSKANDTVISLHVVEIKTALERIREQIQNVE